MGLFILRPQISGGSAIEQIVTSSAIIKDAKYSASKILEDAFTEKEKIASRAYNQGLLLGAEKTYKALNNFSAISPDLKSKIKYLIFEIIKKTLKEILQDEIDVNQNNKLIPRIESELDNYSKQINIDEIKLTLEVSSKVEQISLDPLLKKYPFLNLVKVDELDQHVFIIKSPYGEIHSNPMDFIDLVSQHLHNSVSIDNLFSGDL